MTKRKCEICGQIKGQAEFSKSYRNRCKECVAEMARESRGAAKTAAENLAKISTLRLASPTQPDWEQRRYEIALALFISPFYLTAEEAVMNADDLIKALKESRS